MIPIDKMNLNLSNLSDKDKKTNLRLLEILGILSRIKRGLLREITPWESKEYSTQAYELLKILETVVHFEDHKTYVDIDTIRYFVKLITFSGEFPIQVVKYSELVEELKILTPQLLDSVSMIIIEYPIPKQEEDGVLKINIRHEYSKLLSELHWILILVKDSLMKEAFEPESLKNPEDHNNLFNLINSVIIFDIDSKDMHLKINIDTIKKYIKTVRLSSKVYLKHANDNHESIIRINEILESLPSDINTILVERNKLSFDKDYYFRNQKEEL